MLSSRCSPFRLFEDVEPALKAWAAKSLSVYLFSAGSVDTQKLLFGYSAKGDLQEVRAPCYTQRPACVAVAMFE